MSFLFKCKELNRLLLMDGALSNSLLELELQLSIVMHKLFVLKTFSLLLYILICFSLDRTHIDSSF